jgi:hypothetical protein
MKLFLDTNIFPEFINRRAQRMTRDWYLSYPW